MTIIEGTLQMYMYEDTYLELTEDESIEWFIDILDNNGSPLNVDSHTFLVKIAKEYGTKEVVKTYTNSNGVTVESLGVIKILDLNPELLHGSYKVEISYTNPISLKRIPKHLYLKIYKKL